MSETVSIVHGSGAPDRAIDDYAPPAVVINPHSDLGKELRKWEQHQTELVPRGTRPGNPYVYRPFPKMVYKAVKTPTGKVVCMPALPQTTGFRDHNEYLMAYAEVESLQRQCFKTVDSDDALRVSQGQGWCDSPADAIAQFEKEERAAGDAAAEAAFLAKRMTEQARAEFDKAQGDTMHHVSDVVADKKKKARAANADEE